MSVTKTDTKAGSDRFPAGPQPKAKAKPRLLGIPGWAVSVLSVIIGLLLLQLLNRIINDPLFFAGPIQIVKAAPRLFDEGALGTDIRVSVIEFGIGMAVSIVIGVSFGVLLGVSKLARSIAQPWVSAFYGTPLLALAPIFVIWFGISLQGKVAIVVAVAVFPILISTQSGVEETRHELLELGRVNLFTWREMVAKVYMRSALPFVLAGIRLGIGRGLVGVIVAEFFGAQHGLGVAINQYSQSYDIPGVLFVASLLAITAVLLLAFLKKCEAVSAPWRR
jgi:NitT/TauT family transport system permease protein